MPADPRLDGDDPHAVRYHVVQLTGNPQPLLGQRAPRPVGLRVYPALSLLAQARGIPALGAHGTPHRPGGKLHDTGRGHPRQQVWHVCI